MRAVKTLLIAIAILSGNTLTAQVAITTDGSTAEGSAMLEVKSTEKGFLPPRMTEAQMNDISIPAEGLIVYCTDCNPKGPYYFDGSGWLNFSNNFMSFSDVVNPTTGKTWMDRNLGASQVANSSTDSDSYGDLYQWGRGTDGHEKRNSGTTSTLSSSNTPGHGNFILAPSSPKDWRSPQNDGLWQGVNGVNNPCPSGYRLPTEAEWEAERASWSSDNAAGAFASPLKLPVAGYRYNSDGVIYFVDSDGRYWSSTVDGNYSRGLLIGSIDAFLFTYDRAYGFSIRCLKD